MSEYLTIFDENRRAIGTELRSIVHETGAWHEVFHLWIVVKSTDFEAKIILQKRSASKLQFPEHHDISVAGHLAIGETPENGFREAQEELGLTIGPEDCFYLGIRPDTFSGPGFVNREFAHVYVHVCDQDLINRIEVGQELAGYVSVPFRVFATMVSRHADERDVANSQQNTAYNLVPRSTGYYESVSQNVELILCGNLNFLSI
ncbi:hypothetical protein BWR17_19850 (plasmid) [Phaeobacter inhibens]|uniref:NUDIX hydrolase n=1 Tax=Phaeobacter inhibens TaxID=221822 RepID=UPI00097186BA|nr:NUDIX domain-containing protein [Phaeobacter inhibens]APX18131.1 hypothetical protein BWR17_19850 [Phaeobacter inhibens]